ncbi:MAG: BolA family protein [Alphaproteobacteria bacterium]
MRIEDEIKRIIETELAPAHLEVINESGKHIGHAGDDGSGQTHFKLVVVHERFEGQSRVERQKTINKMLVSLFDKGLHALSMQLYTPQEYKK